MTTLTLGVHGLPQAEAGLVRALVSLAAVMDARWRFVPAGPCDVLVADGKGDGLHLARQERRAQAVILLGTERSNGADTLARPLRADQFETCLRAVARQLVGLARAAAPQVRAEEGGAPSRYKLRRWPPAELLRGEPQRVRMASQLTRRYLSVGEVAQLAQLPPERCQVFLQLLRGFNLLDAEPAAATAGAAAPVPALNAVQRPSGARGLVQSIRRRLGL